MFEAPTIFTVFIFLLFVIVILASLYFMLPCMLPNTISSKFQTDLPEQLLIGNALSFLSATVLGYAIFFTAGANNNWFVQLLIESKTNVTFSAIIGIASSFALLSCHPRSKLIKYSPFFIYFLVLVTIPGLRYEYWLETGFLIALSAKLAAYSAVFAYFGIKILPKQKRSQNQSLQSFLK